MLYRLVQMLMQLMKRATQVSKFASLLDQSWDVLTMNHHHLPSARRGFFRKMLASSGIVVGTPQLQSKPEPAVDSTLLWINASRARVGRDLESDLFESGVRSIRGGSFSKTSIHFDLPLAVGSVLDALWLRMTTESGVTLHSVQIFDCELESVRLEHLQLQAVQWSDVRLQLPQPCVVERSLSVRIECGFDATERELKFAALACEIKQA